jgi:hypothetical protein
MDGGRAVTALSVLWGQRGDGSSIGVEDDAPGHHTGVGACEVAVHYGNLTVREPTARNADLILMCQSATSSSEPCSAAVSQGSCRTFRLPGRVARAHRPAEAVQQSVVLPELRRDLAEEHMGSRRAAGQGELGVERGVPVSGGAVPLRPLPVIAHHTRETFRSCG